MATKTLYITNTAAIAPNWWSILGLQADGAPAAGNTAYGWTFAKSTSQFGAGRLGAVGPVTVLSATSTIDSKTGPTKGTGSAATTSGDSFIAGPYDGSFANTSWAFNFKMRAGTAGMVGRIRMRVWKSVNADGSSATEITAGAVVGATVTLSTTADVNSLITWSPGSITLTDHYLFFQVEWNETTTGTSNSDNCFFRTGTALITTPDFTASSPVGSVYLNDADHVYQMFLTNGQLKATNPVLTSNSIAARANATNGTSHYFEVTINNQGVSTNGSPIGLSNLTWPASTTYNNWLGSDANGIGYQPVNGQIFFNGSALTTVVMATVGDVIGVAINASGNIEFYKNGTLLYTATSFPTGALYPSFTLANMYDAYTANFGATALSFLPSGYTAWGGASTTVATANETVASFTSSGAATLALAATANQTMAAFTSAAADTLKIQAAASQTVASFTSVAAATVKISAIANNTLDTFTTAAADTLKVAAVVNQTVANFTSSAAATLTLAAAANQTMAAFTSSAADALKISATANNTVSDFTSSAVTAVKISATANNTLANFTSAEAAVLIDQAAANQTVANFTSTATGILKLLASANINVAPFTSSAAAQLSIEAIAADTLADFTSVGLASFAPHLVANQTLVDFASVAAATLQILASVDQTLDPFTLSADATLGAGPISATANMTLSNFTSQAFLDFPVIEPPDTNIMPPFMIYPDRRPARPYLVQ